MTGFYQNDKYNLFKFKNIETYRISKSSSIWPKILNFGLISSDKGNRKDIGK